MGWIRRGGGGSTVRLWRVLCGNSYLTVGKGDRGHDRFRAMLVIVCVCVCVCVISFYLSWEIGHGTKVLLIYARVIPSRANNLSALCRGPYLKHTFTHWRCTHAHTLWNHRRSLLSHIHTNPPIRCHSEGNLSLPRFIFACKHLCHTSSLTSFLPPHKRTPH